MNRELIKQAYAYGAGYAFRNAGFTPQETEAQIAELTQDAPAMTDRLALALTGSPYMAGLVAPDDRELRTFAHTYGKGLLGSMLGTTAGGIGGAGLGVLISRLKGKNPIIGGILGGLGGGFLGSRVGKQIGLQKGFTSGYAE